MKESKLFVTVTNGLDEKVLIPLVNIKSITVFEGDAKPFSVFKSVVNYTKGCGLAIRESVEELGEYK